MAKHGPPVTWTEQKAKKQLRELIEWLDDLSQPEHVHIGRFCRERGYYIKDMRKWAKTWPETCGALYEEAKNAVEGKVNTLTLMKKYNDKMGYFTLKNVCGWRDTQDLSVSTKDGKAVGVVILPQRKIDRKKNGDAKKAALDTNPKAK